MTTYFAIEPEVAGGFGEHTVIDRSSGRMVVQHLHYQFQGWLGDQLLESTPCFVVTASLAEQLRQVRLTGVDFGPVEVTTSPEFRTLHPRTDLPEFLWMKIQGKALHDDFGLDDGLQLIVSDRALDVLQHAHAIAHAASVTPL